MNKKNFEYPYKLDAVSFWMPIAAAFLLGGTISYCIWGLDVATIWSKLWNYLKSVSDDNQFLGNSAKILGTLIAIVIPISLTIMSNIRSSYRDEYIARMLTEERDYKRLFWIIGLVVIELILIAFKINHPIVIIIGLLLNFLAFMIFVQYLNTLQKYATQTEEIILEKSKNEIDEIWEEISKDDESK